MLALEHRTESVDRSIDFKLPRLLFASSKARQFNRGCYFFSPSHKPTAENKIGWQLNQESKIQTGLPKRNPTLGGVETFTFQKLVDPRMQKVNFDSKPSPYGRILKGTVDQSCEIVQFQQLKKTKFQKNALDFLSVECLCRAGDRTWIENRLVWVYTLV